jgi:transcriptional regulator with XRE-family HTH domain
LGVTGRNGAQAKGLAGPYGKDDLKHLDPRHVAPRHENLRSAMNARGFTRDQFASVLGVSPSTLDRWLKGDPNNKEAYRMPTDALIRAARLLGVSTWYLLDLTDNPDGAGVRVWGQRDTLRRIWGIAKDPYKVVSAGEPWTEFGSSGASECLEVFNKDITKDYPGDSWYEVDFGDTYVWELVNEGGERHFRQRRWGEDQLNAEQDDYEEARAAAAAEGEAGGGGASAGAARTEAKDWFQVFREQMTEALRRDILGIRGDYRDPLYVLNKELESASKDASAAEVDAMFARVEAQARAIMGTKAMRRGTSCADAFSG